MKIALCLSGQPRGLVKAHSYVKRNLLDKYDVDVFCHTWSNENDISKLYSPISIKEDPPSLLQVSEHYKTRDPINHPARNTFCFFYSIMEADKLRRNSGKNYDVVIRSRYDYAIARSIDFSQFDMSSIWVPMVKIPMPTGFLCTDQFAFSNIENMEAYSNVYPSIDDYYNSGIPINGEDLLSHHIRNNKISVSYVDMWDPFFGGKYNFGPHSLVRDDMEVWKGK